MHLGAEIVAEASAPMVAMQIGDVVAERREHAPT